MVVIITMFMNHLDPHRLPLFCSEFVNDSLEHPKKYIGTCSCTGWNGTGSSPDRYLLSVLFTETLYCIMSVRYVILSISLPHRPSVYRYAQNKVKRPTPSFFLKKRK